MSSADHDSALMPEIDRLRARVADLERECARTQTMLTGLERLGKRSLFWDGTPERLWNLAAQIRLAFGYRAVAFWLPQDGNLQRRAADPPDAAELVILSTPDLDQAVQASQPYMLATGDEQVLLVPLVAGMQRVGLIQIVLNQEDDPEASLILWRAVNSQISSIIVGGRLVLQVEEARHHEQLLYDISRYLSSGLNLEKMLTDVLTLTVPRIGADDGSILLLDTRQRVTDHIGLRHPRVLAQEQDLIRQVMTEGLAGWIVHSRQSVVIQDTRTDERWTPGPGATDAVRSVLGVPLRRGSRTHGLLFLVHHQPGYFKDDHLSFTTSVAEQMTVAIENARLMDQTQQRLEELALINEISRAVSSLHLDDVLRIVTRSIVEALQVQRCAVFLLSEDQSELVLRAVHGPEAAEDHMNLVIPMADRPHIAEAIQTQRPVEVPDVFADERLREFWPRAQELGIQSQLAVPLISKQYVIGAIGIDLGASYSHVGESDLNLCQTIAQQAATAIDNARLYEEVRRRVDQLSLANRISHDVGTQLDIHQLLWEVVRLIRETFDCYYVMVGLIEGDSLVFRSGITYLYDRTSDLCLPLNELQPSIAAWVARNGRSLLVPDVHQDPLYRPRPGLPDVRSQLSVPLKVLERADYLHTAKDQTIGVLDLGSAQGNAFSSEDRQLLEALAAQISVAIQNAGLFSRVQEERATLEAIINGTDDAIIITDMADRVMFFNPAAQQAFDYDQPLQPGASLYDVLNNEALWELWRQAGQDQAHSAEIPLADGRTLHASITPIPEVGKVAMMQDITYLKELDAMKSEFVSTVSHDLRSPLQVIQTSAELIPRLGEISAEQRREIEHILAIVRRISDLVQNLLDIGRIEAGVGMEVQPCAIDEIIASAAGSCRALAQDKNLEFTVDLPRTLPLVIGDPVRLDQVISNLVTNAIKFTPEGSVTVSAWSDQEWVALEVRDTGIGIPVEAQEKLFQKFYRVKTPETRGIQGTGLGLAIVKSIVESYGGQIQVESFPRLGSVFTVRLPVYEKAAITPA